ncbi:MAG: hypothetical protein IT372_25820, partial [Polyangiaceae bacterium]|nr:hypothetical protein [Polyangiaceae bacterium]
MSGRRISLEIVSAGLRTVLGGGCLAAAMMARAVRFTPRLTELRDARGERIRMGIVEGVPRDLLGALRLVAIAAPALVEAAGGAAAALGRREPLPVWLAMPEAGRPDDDPRLSAQVLDLLARASGVRIDLDRSGVVRAGRAGGAEVVERAAALWGGAEPAPAAVIVGGVDSAHHPALVEAIERRRAEEPGSWSGALRSEGAAFVALAPPGAAP